MRVGRCQANGGLAQLGEHLPYKQGVGGSIPSSSTIYIYYIKPIYAGVAQLVEHLTCNQRVEGSNPFAGTPRGGSEVAKRGGL